MAEDRTEDAGVVTTAVAETEHRVVGHAVRQAKTRRERGERALDVEVEANALAAGDEHLAGVHVDEAALARSGHGLGTIDLPAQAVVDRQPRRGLPLILSVEEPAILPFFGVGHAADISLEYAHITEQE